ncbi:SusD/RagB family nutrient-binding outer membrane lipoprotein [Chitinophaga lutea]
MKHTLLIAAASLLFAACNKFGDMNVDPNRPTRASNTQLIANSQLYLPVLQENPQGEYFGQYLSETQYPNLSLFNQVSASFYGIYQGPLMNLDTVLRGNTYDLLEGPAANQQAVATILRAYFFWHATDRWGDLPYTQALLGRSNFTPVYDTQESIYNDLFTQLTAASNMIVAGNIKNDLIYGGDPNKWKRLANTIRLLMALRLSQVAPAKAQTEFNAALTAGIMTSNDDNFIFKHLAKDATESYWFNQVSDQNRKWWALSETLVSKMKPVNDPRLPIYGDKNAAGNYVGLEFGKLDGLSTTAFSLLGAEQRRQDAKVYLVTYAQALFAQAEGAKRNWIAGGDVAAADFYYKGIERSIHQWKGDTLGFGVMKAAPSIAYVAANGMEQIATQRWVHLFMHGFEAWAEWRRTGWPVLVKPQGKEIPTRQGYPSDEVFNNKTNYQEAVSRQFGTTGDGLYGKLWWDKP